MKRWQDGIAFGILAGAALAGEVAFRKQAIGTAVIPEFALQNVRVIFLAQRRVGLTIEEGEKGVAAAAGHRRDLMQRAAGEDDGAAVRCAIGAAAEFWKGQIAAVIVLVEVDGDGETTMLRAGIDVVAVPIKMPADGAVITGDDIAIHPRGRELKEPFDGRKETTHDLT